MPPLDFRKAPRARNGVQDPTDPDDDAPPPQSPLAPADSVAGRSLVIVIAIMTFLAALSAGAALLVADASADWRKEVAREASVQIRPTPGRDLEADVRKAAALLAATPGVREALVYTKAESEALLAPGSDTASTSPNCRRRA